MFLKRIQLEHLLHSALPMTYPRQTAPSDVIALFLRHVMIDLYAHLNRFWSIKTVMFHCGQ